MEQDQRLQQELLRRNDLGANVLRMVPVDFFVCGLVQRLRFFRSFDPLPPDGRLLARPSAREALIRQLRRYLHAVCAEIGIAKRIVPHQVSPTCFRVPRTSDIIPLASFFPHWARSRFSTFAIS
jgi:hypothetical protein